MLDFWPLIEAGFKKRPVTKFHKIARYSDGKWKYEADSDKGITIEVTCECGKVHKVKLGPGLVCEPAEKGDDIIDI